VVAIRWDDLDDGQDDEDAWWLALLSEPPVGAGPGILERAASLRPAWQARAACAGLGPGRFYSLDAAVVEAARAVCEACPVSGPCGAAGRQERFGVWGGRRRAPRTS